MTILLENISPDPNTPTIRSGHKAYYGIVKQSNKPIVCKKNKHDKSLNSKFEVAFSAIAKLFLAPGTTANYELVTTSLSGIPEVYGVASENLASSLQLFNQDSTSTDIVSEKYFYNPATITESGALQKIKCASAQDLMDNKIIGLFDQHKNNLIPLLLRMKNTNQLTFNMRSLASVLSTSYTLEEDDFHKGNFGFYIIDKNGKAEVNFIKIDHDLMLSDSIMSREGGRIANILYNEHSFDITMQDIIRFPDIKNSGNHYWPSRHAIFTDYTSSKAYTRKENKAIAQLKTDPDFIKAKWFELYKHILISPQAIENAAREGFNDTDPNDIAYVHIITQAVVARQARLRAALVSIPEFCQFVRDMDDQTAQLLLNEIDPNHEDLQYLQTENLRYKTILLENKLFLENTKNTPLHTAILLGNYRFDESYRDFSRYLNVKNSEDKTPLDLALESYIKYQQSNIQVSPYNPGNDQVQIIQHLIKHGAKASKYTPNCAVFKETSFAKQTFYANTPYYAESQKITTANDLIDMFLKLSNDSHYTLKRKKQLTVACLNAFIRCNKINPNPAFNLIDELKAFKSALNGRKSNLASNPALQYLCQLRSRLWIVRRIRGLLGGSSTKVRCNDIIDKAIQNLEQDPNYFFNLPQPKNHPAQDPVSPNNKKNPDQILPDQEQETDNLSNLPF